MQPGISVSSEITVLCILFACYGYKRELFMTIKIIVTSIMYIIKYLRKITLKKKLELFC